MSLPTLGKYDGTAIHRNYIHDTQQILYCTRKKSVILSSSTVILLKLALNEPSITKHCFQRLVLNLGYSIWALANDNNYHFIKSIRFIINFIQYIITCFFQLLMNFAAALHLLMVFNGKNRIRQRNKNSIVQNSCTYTWETSLKLLQFQYKLLHIQYMHIS